MQKKEMKKLHLSRETLATLDARKLAGAAGGSVTFKYTNCHCTYECTTNCA